MTLQWTLSMYIQVNSCEYITQWTFPISHGHVQDVAQPLLSVGSTLKNKG